MDQLKYLSMSKSERDQYNAQQAVIEFTRKLISNQKDLDPEFSKVVDENYWDLI